MGLLDLIKRDKKTPANNQQIQQMQNMQFQGQQPGMLPAASQPNAIMPPIPQQFPNQQTMMNQQQPPQGIQFQQPIPQAQRQPVYDKQLAQVPVDPTPVQNDYGYGDPQIPQQNMQKPLTEEVSNQPVQMYGSLPVSATMQAEEPMFEQIPAPEQSISTEDMSRKLEQSVPSPYENPLTVNESSNNQQTTPDFSNIQLPDFSTFTVPETVDQQNNQNIEVQAKPEENAMPTENLEILPVADTKESPLDIPAEEPIQQTAESGNQAQVLIGTNQNNEAQPANVSEPEEVAQEENNSSALQEAPQYDFPNLDLSNLDLSNIDLKPLSSEVPAEQTEQKVEQEAVIPVAENIDETVQTAVEESPVTQSRKKLLFKKIGIFGLNGPNSQNIPVEDLSNMIHQLVQKDIEIIIDSKNSAGETVINKISELKKLYTGVYLMPLMSHSAESINESIVNKEGSAVLYSNYIERLRHLAKEPRLHIFFDGGGLTNLSVFLSMWNIATLYPDNHKPIILVGSNWKNIIDQLAQGNNIDDKEMKVLTFVDSVEKVVEAIENLNVAFPAIKNNRPIRIVDRRVEGDESDFIVY